MSETPEQCLTAMLIDGKWFNLRTYKYFESVYGEVLGDVSMTLALLFVILSLHFVGITLDSVKSNFLWQSVTCDFISLLKLHVGMLIIS